MALREWGEPQRSVMLPFGRQLAGIALCSPGCSLRYLQDRDEWYLRRPSLMLSDWALGGRVFLYFSARGNRVRKGGCRR